MKPGAHLKGHGTKQVVIETISAETGLVPLTTTLMTLTQSYGSFRK